MRRNKAQTIAEYALLIVIIVAAIAAMQVYVKRGLQARYKKITDCAAGSVGVRQYEPYYASLEQIIDQEHQTTYTYVDQEQSATAGPLEGVRLRRGINSIIKVENATITRGLDIKADDEWY